MEEQEKFIKAFLELLDISFVKEDELLPRFVLERIAKGQEDIKAGRSLTMDEFKKRMDSTTLNR